MSNLNVTCPNCQSTFELTEAIAEPMRRAAEQSAKLDMENRIAKERASIEAAVVERLRREHEAKELEYDLKFAGQEVELKKAREAEIAALKAKEEAEEAKRNVDIEVARRVHAETSVVTDRVRGQVIEEYALKMSVAEARVTELLDAAEAKDAELKTAREAELAARKAKQEADEVKRNAEIEVARRVAEQTAAVAARAREEAGREFGNKLKAAEAQLAEVEGKRRAAEEAELAARKAKAEAEEAKRQSELLVERRIDEERGKVREQALKERDDDHRLKMLEKERQLAELKEKLDEAQRKADLGSQQRKGDVLELDLHDALSAAFPGDEFERIKKGQKGGDLIHTVRSSSGLVCGRIKWESKHTQNWLPGWLPKLRADQREHKCDIAAIVSETLPDGVDHFDVIDEVWVSGIATVLPMAAALRRGLIDTATARRAAAGADSQKDLVYGYLTGPEFRARVRGVVEPIVEMRTSLDAEKRSAQRQFAAREKQLERVGLSLSGMYGDLQGLIGPSLPTVEGLALPEPAEGDDTSAPQLTSGDGEASGAEVH